MASDAENDESSVRSRSSSSGSDSSRAHRQRMKAARQRKDGQRAKKKRREYQMTVLQKKKILEEADRCKPGVGRGRTGAMTLESFCTHLLRLPEFADRKTISRKSITRVLAQREKIEKRAAQLGGWMADARCGCVRVCWFDD
ncbi:MAG: hypothetical protein FJ077_12250 [Cyanobacteria bacterium K_DeepCast_35m_m2_023]|nr:hypothetical protein [Cyanobacteria bacterium K_DeepCast_35m_m2_023]